MRYNFVIVVFPVYLIFFEILFRTFSNIDTSAFLGPTISAGGLSLLISLVKPKTVNLDTDNNELLRLIEQHNLTIKNDRDEKLIVVIWVMILIGILVWYWSCATSLLTPTAKIWVFPKHFLIGLINYLLGVVFTTLKEIV